MRDQFDARERFVLAMLLLGWGPRDALADCWNVAVEINLPNAGRRGHG